MNQIDTDIVIWQIVIKMQHGYGMAYVKIVGGSKMDHRCHDKDCDSYGKKLVWVPIDYKGNYMMQCPNEILTQSEYNLKFVKYESKAQMEEDDRSWEDNSDGRKWGN